MVTHHGRAGRRCGRSCRLGTHTSSKLVDLGRKPGDTGSKCLHLSQHSGQVDTPERGLDLTLHERHDLPTVLLCGTQEVVGELCSLLGRLLT
ncbi:MAG: hypothetical protein ACRCSN_11400 [Dermatophilaceae bacterium]